MGERSAATEAFVSGEVSGPPSVPRTHAAPTVGGVASALATLLDDAGVGQSKLEARDIVAAILNVPRFWPVANRHVPMSAVDVASATAAAERRAAGAPFAYAVRRAAFRHLTMEVDERVLIPRQETEQLVELVLAETRDSGSGRTAIDIGTGSGAIALALASEGSFAHVIGTDLSSDAIVVAQRNGELAHRALTASIEWRVGAGLAPVRGVSAHAVVSNPPYVALAESASLPRSVRDWEPAIALFGGQGGMDVLAAIVADAAPVLEIGGLLALEIDTRRATLTAELVSANAHYGDVSVAVDLTGRDRFVLARRCR
ncbi:MAG: peptide chain release factor N(5)-glutamine methyltransferase [Gemmatimonadaceae bacterium]